MASTCSTVLGSFDRLCHTRPLQDRQGVVGVAMLSDGLSARGVSNSEESKPPLPGIESDQSTDVGNLGPRCPLRSPAGRSQRILPARARRRSLLRWKWQHWRQRSLFSRWSRNSFHVGLDVASAWMPQSSSLECSASLSARQLESNVPRHVA